MLSIELLLHKMADDYQVYTSKSGFRMAYKHITGSRVVNCGYVINTGSRNDLEHPGIAHCLEHMVFKGTEKRKTIHVLNHLEVVGGEMNAFTSKELTAIYATVQSTHFGRALDILTDVTFHSKVPENELIKEKKVISEEINMYLDTPEENIYDEFQEMVFGKHPLAHNILGTVESLNAISRKDLLDFVKQNYTRSNLIFVVVGNVPYSRAVQLFEKHTANLEVNDNKAIQNKQTFLYSPQSVVRETDFVQSYCILGIPAYEQTHANRWKLLLLNNLLGGPGLNSRLNLAIREKYGFTYNVESGYQSFSDAGMFHCYLSSEKKYIDRSRDLVIRELDKLRKNQLGSLQLSRAKNQFMGQLVLNDENKSGIMIHIGKGILTQGKARTLKETLDEIRKISAMDILETANEIFDIPKLSYLTYVPE